MSTPISQLFGIQKLTSCQGSTTGYYFTRFIEAKNKDSNANFIQDLLSKRSSNLKLLKLNNFVILCNIKHKINQYKTVMLYIWTRSRSVDLKIVLTFSYIYSFAQLHHALPQPNQPPLFSCPSLSNPTSSPCQIHTLHLCPHGNIQYRPIIRILRTFILCSSKKIKTKALLAETYMSYWILVLYLLEIQVSPSEMLLMRLVVCFIKYSAP